MIFLYILFTFILIFGFVVFRGAPYVPSQKKYVNEAFTKLYKLSQNDVLLDVGSGDGKVLRLASARGATAIGYELNPVLVIISRLLSLKNGKVSVKLADLWLEPIPEKTTVIYVFAVTRDIHRIIQKIQGEVNRVNREIHVISYGNSFEDIKPVKELGAYHLYKFSPLHAREA